jgi:putative oxidoreductase
MKEATISRIAIIILGIVLAAYGIYHFSHKNQDYLIGFMPSFLPGGSIWFYIVGVAFILAGLAFIFHTQVKLAGYLLALLLFLFALTIHLPNYLHSGDVEMQQLSYINFLKDLAIAAFALYIASNSKKL